MKFTIITAFPEAFSYLNESIPKRAVEKKLVEIEILNLRDFTSDKWKSIDDKPFGGGHGMLMMVEPIYKALKSIGVYPKRSKKTKIILLSAKGQRWHQSKVESYQLELGHIVLICGHYEGIDERVAEHLIDEEISIGNYILSGGELGAMVVVDSIIRLVPGVVGAEESVKDETKFTGESVFPEYPQYTRPASFKTEEGEEWEVPEILTSGNHAEIERWKEGHTSASSV